MVATGDEEDKSISGTDTDKETASLIALVVAGAAIAVTGGGGITFPITA
jgi:hypothetical protein